jgi:hypothetical protein
MLGCNMITAATRHDAFSHTAGGAVDCCLPADTDKANAVLPIGGPGKALSAKEQADILFR